MDKDKIEIKIESKVEHYYRIIKQKFHFLIKAIFIISALITVLYVGFYLVFFFIILLGLNYLIKMIKNN